MAQEEAYHFAEEHHEGQLRKSGHPHIVHRLDAAFTVASLQLDAGAIAAALLHDVQEDCGVPSDEIKRCFRADSFSAQVRLEYTLSPDFGQLCVLVPDP